MSFSHMKMRTKLILIVIVPLLGLHPRLVASDSTNFKVTYAQDLHLAELLLRHA